MPFFSSYSSHLISSTLMFCKVLNYKAVRKNRGPKNKFAQGPAQGWRFRNRRRASRVWFPLSTLDLHITNRACRVQVVREPFYVRTRWDSADFFGPYGYDIFRERTQSDPRSKSAKSRLVGLAGKRYNLQPGRTPEQSGSAEKRTLLKIISFLYFKGFDR